MDRKRMEKARDGANIDEMQSKKTDEKNRPKSRIGKDAY